MKQRSFCPGRLSTAIAIALCCFPPFSSGQENPGTVYQFNDGFIVGSREKVDLSRFSTSAITEGTYSLDVYTNDEWKGRYDLRIARDKDGRLGVCYTKAMLAQYGIAAEKLNPQLSEQEGYCGSLKSWRNEENVKDNLVQSSLRLNISVPQIYEDQRLKNYVSPEFWDKGITALNLGWMANAWNSHTSSVGGSDNSSAYLGVNAGLSWDGWLLKHIGNLNWQQQQGKAHWNSNQTYLQRPIPQLNSIVSGGQIFTNGEFFDTIGLRGVNLSTDDNMFPDGMRSYAPEIRGVAQSNALVTVRQGEGYRQSGIGASGTMIAHSGGVVLSPESGSTMALIEAKDAAGAMLPGSPGTRVDSNGYAILPYLRPYRINAVEIDPKGSHDDVAFDRTVAQVVPWEGSVVKVAFGTKVQNNLTLQARQANHEPLPFAASIFSPDGKEIGVVGQGSMMFISDANAKRAIVKWSGGQCSVDLGQQTTKDSVCR
ncbi:TPA: fimbrial biogenesis outer membrane usher protein [Enterobacter hormaechei subsp. oharae]|nr:fimbrial biogenesis outer membrane usher protein [Enterobacter hormaechei subsp. oharae]